jgi:3-oxoacyl-[acyl-carrier-protein] synthase II
MVATIAKRADEINPGRAVGEMYVERLPSLQAHALVDFNIKQLLGRKGTTFLDRRCALALVACDQAIEDSGINVDDENRHRVGIALGTTWGSMKSMCDYTRDTLTEERPYLVNPILFPNTVMNCAAGQAAIRYGLKGVNATLAGDQIAFLSVLRYVANVLRCSYADVILAGAVDEFTPHAAWATHLAASTETPLTAGEGAGVFVIQRRSDATCAGRHFDAEVLSVVMGFVPGAEPSGGMTRALEGCIRSALRKANVRPEDLSAVATGETGDDGRDRVEADALRCVLGNIPVERVPVKKALGECHAATGALQLAALLALHRDELSRDGRFSLITGWAPDGGIGAAVLRGWSRAGSHHW